MRIFQSFPAALSEVERDLKELGAVVPRKSWQGKESVDHDRLTVRELQNYQYTVLKPDLDDLKEVNQPWADAEFKERISKEHVNPGEAWKLRPLVWEELIEPDAVDNFPGNPTPGFSYTYNERIKGYINGLINLLVHDPTSRRAYLPIYWFGDPSMAIDHRVPCSLGYHFQAEHDRLNMTYYMRSCDWTRHFQDDVYLALRLRGYIIEQYNEAVDEEKGEKGDGTWKPYFKPGAFTHNIANLHVFEKDVSHVF